MASNKKLSNEFGANFQIKAITAVCTDPDFLDRTADILNSEFFDGDSKQWIVEKTLEFHSQYKDRPTASYFREELKNVASDSLRASIINNLRKMKSKRESPDLDYVKEHFLEFCKQQKVKNVIEESVDLLQLGDYDSIKQKMDEALSAGMRKDVGHDYMEDAKKRMNEPARNTVPTGYPVLDNEVLDGGLAPGEIGVFMGATGAGKCIGSDTEIEIEYEQIGIEADGITAWFDPWETLDTSVGKRTVSKKTTVGKLFDDIGVDDEPEAIENTNYDVRVKTPSGYKSVARFFRTEKQKSVRVYFGNGSTLECSWDHKLKANGRWQKVKNLDEGDQIETEKGTTTKVSEIKEKSREKALYDMSVEDVHCYYSNGVLSHNSWVLSTLGANAMEEGKNIVHYTLELSENQTGFRYDSIFTEYAPTEVQDHKEEVLSALEHVPGNASIQYWPTKGASTQTIRAHLDRMETVKWKPDLILIDYADLLQPLGAQRSDSDYEKMGNIYEDLRKLSGEVGIPIWTVSQTQRRAVGEKVVKGDRIADSWKKAMTADFICSVSRTETDALAETARFHVIKSRFGPDKKTYPAIMSTATGSVRIFDPESEQGKELMAKMEQNEEKRKQEEISQEYQKWKFKRENRKSKKGEKASIGV